LYFKVATLVQKFLRTQSIDPEGGDQYPLSEHVYLESGPINCVSALQVI